MLFVVGVILDFLPEPPPPTSDVQPAEFPGLCMEVTAREIRVFKTPDVHNRDIWTQWDKGTRFWVDLDNSTEARYRTLLRNGNHGWIGTSPQTPIRPCPERPTRIAPSMPNTLGIIVRFRHDKGIGVGRLASSAAPVCYASFESSR